MLICSMIKVDLWRNLIMIFTESIEIIIILRKLKRQYLDLFKPNN